MEKKIKTPLPGIAPAVGGTPTALFGRLDALNAQVNKLLNDPVIRRMALDVGIVLLSKRYPALSFLLGGLGETTPKQSAPKRAPGRKPAPTRKIGRGIK